MIEKIKEFIGDMFSEDGEKISTIRVLATLIVIVVLFNWSYTSVSTGELAEFDWVELAALLGALFAKVYQKGKEKK